MVKRRIQPLIDSESESDSNLSFSLSESGSNDEYSWDSEDSEFNDDFQRRCIIEEKIKLSPKAESDKKQTSRQPKPKKPKVAVKSVTLEAKRNLLSPAVFTYKHIIDDDSTSFSSASSHLDESLGLDELNEFQDELEERSKDGEKVIRNKTDDNKLDDKNQNKNEEEVDLYLLNDFEIEINVDLNNVPAKLIKQKSLTRPIKRMISLEEYKKKHREANDITCQIQEESAEKLDKRRTSSINLKLYMNDRNQKMSEEEGDLYLLNDFDIEISVDLNNVPAPIEQKPIKRSLSLEEYKKKRGLVY